MDWAIRNVDPVSTITEALDSMDGLINERNIDLIVDIPDDIPNVRVDRDQLLQVVINLVSNAVKFCANPDGIIRVRAHRHHNILQVSISDNGKGILPEHLDFIFEKFHQTRQGSNLMPIGTGLGLAICRQIITFFGGDIWADNEEDGGACITFNVPFAQPERDG